MLQSVAIIVINYNLKEDTADCIDSLLQAGAQLEQIRVVDNGSTDGSIEFLRARFGESLAIEASPVNRGFAFAVNTGIKAALPGGAGWFLILNNDTLVDAHFLEELERAATSHRQYDLWGPLILYHSQPNTIWFLAQRLIPGTLITRRLQFQKDERHLKLDEVFPADFLSGCTMMIGQRVVEKIGLFEEISLIYAEEVEYCWRARQAGFKMATATRARMWHKVSTTMNKTRPKTRYLRIRNQNNFYRRYAKGLQQLLMFLFTLVRSLWITVNDLLLRQPELLAPLWRGFWDGWRGKMGDNAF